MEIPELISLLETKLKAKMEEFQKAEKETALAKHAMFNELRSLQLTMNKIKTDYPAVVMEYFKENDGDIGSK